MASGKIGITKQYVVDCGNDNCVEYSVHDGYLLKDAVHDFREEGWKLRRGKWICPTCIQEEDCLKDATKLILTLKEYINLLIEELNDVVQTATVHGWKTHRYEQGEKLRTKIAELEEGER